MAIERCFEEGDLLPALKEFSLDEFNKANLKCAEAMRDGRMEEAREYAYAAKAIESYPEDFMRFMQKQITVSA
jgi:hypothetical protein